jgi:hypothetical protein
MAQNGYKGYDGKLDWKNIQIKVLEQSRKKKKGDPRKDKAKQERFF